MGNCISHPHDVLSSGLPPEATVLMEQERDFFLNEVDFNMYWSQVKLVGYTMKLRPEHMKEIVPSINLDYEKDILENKKYGDPKKIVMCDKNFGFEDGQHDPQKLLMIGFLYCTFDDPLQHIQELWFMINPQFKATVPRSTVQQMIEDLLYISIDQRIKVLSNMEEHDEQKRYLNTVEAQKEQFLELIMQEFGDYQQISRTAFSLIITPPFTRTYSLRALVQQKVKNMLVPISRNVMGRVPTAD